MTHPVEGAHRTGPEVELEGARATYRRLFNSREALGGVSFRAEPGTVTALLGENGAGKTTLLRVVLGLLPLSEGRASVGGRQPRAYRRRVGVGYVPDSPLLPGRWTVRELLHQGARLARIERRRRARTVVGVLDAVFASELVDRRLEGLSKGQSRRVCIAYALLGDPALLVLDEPFTGLDPRFRARLRGLIQARADTGTTVLISTHEILEMEGGADRAVILTGGRVRAVVEGDQIRAGSLTRLFGGDDA